MVDKPKKKIKTETTEIIVIDKNINNLDDLISLAELYEPNKKYNIDLRRLNKILPELIELNNIIGMETVKKSIVNQIIFFLQDFQTKNSDMLHTVIQGSPGVGKTLLAKLIGKIYHKLNIIQSPSVEHYIKYKHNNNLNFVIARRSDLIAEYLGQTAIKTQKVIDSALGGVLFIDEAYSLGNQEKRDSYAKECIDTLNLNLTEKKNQLLVIIAGYKESLDKCFFSYNEGLKRRFPFIYTIEPYNYKELRQILIKMIRDLDGNWDIRSDDDIPENFFKDNMKLFNNYAGDMETLLFNIKLEHSRRLFCNPNSYNDKKKINKDDLMNALDIFKSNQDKKRNEVWEDIQRRMYL